MALHVSWKLIGFILIFSCLLHCLYAQGKSNDDNQRTESVDPKYIVHDDVIINANMHSQHTQRDIATFATVVYRYWS